MLTGPIAFRQLVSRVPFYEGITLEEIGGRGVRWPAREQASAMPAGDVGSFSSRGRASARALPV